MTFIGYIFGTRCDGDLLRKLSARRVKETSVQLSWAGTTREGNFNPERVYEIALYETLRENGDPAYFPDVIIDTVSHRRYHQDSIAFALLQDVVSYVSRSGIKTRVKISKNFFEDGRFAYKGKAIEVFDKFRAEGIEACFVEKDANKVMWMTDSGGKRK